MGRYIESILMPKENVVYETRLHWGIYIVPLLLCMFVIGFFILPFTYIKRKTNEFAITDRRVIAKTGVISRDSLEIPLNKIESVIFQQGILGRALNYGTIVIGGSGGSGLAFSFIGDPLQFKRMVDMACETRQNSGAAIEE